MTQNKFPSLTSITNKVMETTRMMERRDSLRTGRPTKALADHDEKASKLHSEIAQDALALAKESSFAGLDEVAHALLRVNCEHDSLSRTLMDNALKYERDNQGA